ncbi:hypothetical protein PoB_001562600 [Plakobranchus ocellatus]|uniref:Uncharacterized protein n=1 Tax=Plakobranchus ocellatus TaxID=259542 RepID=A0AAV3YPQ2_9GAST|nr:hypothetical protein PoB_001562600 [Plakobranchus ocellatus]
MERHAPDDNHFLSIESFTKADVTSCEESQSSLGRNCCRILILFVKNLMSELGFLSEEIWRKQDLFCSGYISDPTFKHGEITTNRIVNI